MNNHLISLWLKRQLQSSGKIRTESLNFFFFLLKLQICIIFFLIKSIEFNCYLCISQYFITRLFCLVYTLVSGHTDYIFLDLYSIYICLPDVEEKHFLYFLNGKKIRLRNRNSDIHENKGKSLKWANSAFSVVWSNWNMHIQAPLKFQLVTMIHDKKLKLIICLQM